jgi:hypothetical protein
MKKSISIILSFLILFALNLNAQKKDYPTTRFIRPLAFTQQPYGIDNVQGVVSVGAFDNYTISTTPGFMETDVAVSRSNPLNFVATDNRITGYFGTPYVYYTTNGGVSWNSATVTASSGDPAFACDAAGNFYLCYLGGGAGIRFQKSTNGGQSWGTAVSITTTSSVDKEWIACDQTTGTYQNNVYMAHFYTATGSQRVDFYRSTNNGTAWLGPNTIAPTVTTNPGPNIVVDWTGKVYVFITTYSGAVYRISTDGGATFGSTITAAGYTEPGVYNSTTGRYLVKGNIRTNGHPQAATDLSNGPYKGYVYISYAANPPGPDNANVYCARTTNGGASFEYPVQVNDDGTTTDQWMSDVSVDDAGRVWVYWYDSRNDPSSNLLTEFYGAVSTNGGATFSQNFKISNQNFNPYSIYENQGDHYYIGDYTGMSGRTMTFPVYSGQNNSRNDYCAYLPDYGISFSKASDNLTVSNTSVNYVRIPMMGNYSGTVTYSASVSPTPGTGTITFAWSPSNVKVLTGTPDSLKLSATTSSNCSYGTYTVTVTGVETGGPRTHTRTYTLVVGSTPSGINNNNQTAYQYNLYQNYPNPFNPSTNIEFFLPKQSLVNLKVYDIIGKEITTLVNNVVKKEGLHQVYFDGSNLSSGVYYYKITAGEFTDIKKMTLIK